uniref:Uncharacterized protein n=1 Tax=Setaria digitata TaxID=48799 RepID=A0A915Q628_9BILA
MYIIEKWGWVYAEWHSAEECGMCGVAEWRSVEGCGMCSVCGAERRRAGKSVRVLLAAIQLSSGIDKSVVSTVVTIVVVVAAVTAIVVIVIVVAVVMITHSLTYEWLVVSFIISISKLATPLVLDAPVILPVKATQPSLLSHLQAFIQ